MQEVINVVRRIVWSRIRHADWREDAMQNALLGVWKTILKQGEVSEPLIARITMNACHSICRSHFNDPAQLEDFMLDAILSIPDTELMIDVMNYVELQNPLRRGILKHLLAGEPYTDFDDLGKQVGASKATVSRTIQDATTFVKGWNAA